MIQEVSLWSIRRAYNMNFMDKFTAKGFIRDLYPNADEEQVDNMLYGKEEA